MSLLDVVGQLWVMMGSDVTNRLHEALQNVYEEL